jgi:hypothetical protein
MECYEGATMIKTYRGTIGNQEQDHIRLKTNKGDIGYRIVKFEIIDTAPGTGNLELVVKIYKLKQSSVDASVNFTDGDLLGVGFWQYNASNPTYSTPYNIIFDREIFNQDIYITNRDISLNAKACNYYLELEQVKLNENESTMATLQSLRRLALPRN